MEKMCAIFEQFNMVKFIKVSLLPAFFMQSPYVPAILSRRKGPIESVFKDTSEHLLIGPSTFFRGQVIRIEDQGDVLLPVSVKR